MTIHGRHEPSFRDGEAIDMDRVVVDPEYRRRVIARLRAEAATDASLSTPRTPAPLHGD